MGGVAPERAGGRCGRPGNAGHARGNAARSEMNPPEGPENALVCTGKARGDPGKASQGRGKAPCFPGCISPRPGKIPQATRRFPRRRGTGRALWCGDRGFRPVQCGSRDRFSRLAGAFPGRRRRLPDAQRRFPRRRRGFAKGRRPARAAAAPRSQRGLRRARLMPAVPSASKRAGCRARSRRQ
jgi:hypothetical protein